MKKFEVFLYDENPFRVPFPRQGKVVIEAESEERVKEFFADAKKRNVASVRGFHLNKIVEVIT